MNIRKHRTVVSGLVLLVVLAFAAVGVQAQTLHVGVMQILEHPALDAARDGFMERMAELGYTDVQYDIQSAQGDFSTALTIAQKFQADNVDLVLAIATPTAQAAVQVLQDTPIFFTAVTDPVESGLVDSIERPGGYATGTSDLTPIKSQLELLLQLVPEATRVGVVYNAGEVNSVVQAEIAHEAAAELGLTLVEATATNSAEVMQAAQSLADRVDAYYVWTDNLVVSAIESVVAVAERVRLPLIVGEEDSVRSGGLATIGINYHVLGRQTADIAHRVLQGADPAETPVEYLEDVSMVLNVDAAARMGVELPDELLDRAVEIIRDED